MILLGAALAACYVVFAEWRGGRSRTLIYGVGLIVAALIYVVFAAVASAGDWMGTEVGGFFVFTALAVGGMRRYSFLLALGWALHVGWDAWLHVGPGTDFVPTGYVALCVGFDLVVAGAILATSLFFGKTKAPDG